MTWKVFLHDFDRGEYFSTHIIITIKEKTEKLNFINMRTPYSSRDKIKRVKRQRKARDKSVNCSLYLNPAARSASRAFPQARQHHARARSPAPSCKPPCETGTYSGGGRGLAAFRTENSAVSDNPRREKARGLPALGWKPGPPARRNARVTGGAERLFQRP